MVTNLKKSNNDKTQTFKLWNNLKTDILKEKKTVKKT